MLNQRNDLTANIDRLHTTPMGIERIKKNLALEVPDVVEWCKEQTEKADCIIRKGKNWYVYKDDAVITINARSYTIITAHRSKVRVREITPLGNAVP